VRPAQLALPASNELNSAEKISHLAGLLRIDGISSRWKVVLVGMYYTYVLFSEKDRRLYVGYSHDVFERFKQHASGQVLATTNRRPLVLIYYEAYLSEFEAKRRERYLQGGNGRRTLKIQLSETLKGLGYRCL
jgi:putative endonuclease